MKTHDLAIVCDGLRLKAEIVLPDEPRGIVVLLHGVPSIAPPEPDDDGYPGFARRVADGGWATVWADMRATRGSPGFFSLEGWVRDARAVVDAARAVEEVAGLRLALVGSSAGGVVAAEATARGAPVDALALLAAPSSWVSFAGEPHEGVARIVEQAGMELAAEVLADPTDWAAEFERVTAEGAVARTRVPVLIMHGTADVVVPVTHADGIAARASRARVEIIDGALHQLRRDPRATELLLEWLDQVIA